MTKSKLWTYVAAGAVLAIALGSAALGANPSSNVTAAVEHHGATTLPDEASRVASAVLGALTGGANPSTVASNGTEASEHAANANAQDAKADKADKSKDKADKADKDAADKEDADKDEADKDQADKDQADKDEVDKDVSEGQASKPASTTGAKAGWGCGDEKHTHSGPPGRPGASMPPGCATAKSH